MKKLFILFILSFIIYSVHSQIISEMYFGDYPFFYRVIDSNLNSENISKNKISKVEIKGFLWDNFKINWVKTYDCNGILIKQKAKRTKFIVHPPQVYLKMLFRKKSVKTNINEIDSTTSGQINFIKYSGRKESYTYNQNGKLIHVYIDHGNGISFISKIKEVYLDYDNHNNLIFEKVIYVAGDSTITNHLFSGYQIIETVSKRYFFEDIQLSKTEHTWRLAEKPEIEIFEYAYLETGLIDVIRIVNKTDNKTRIIQFKYK